MSDSTIWIDIDNPPQVQYLVPVGAELERRGYDVVFTARDVSITYQLLQDRGVDFLPVGRNFGKHKLNKISGVIGRAFRLRRTLRSRCPRLVVSASRSATLAAKLMNIPRVFICDYEHVELTSIMRLGAYLAFPDVIDPEIFSGKGFPENRLLPFPGLKEHLTFHGRDTANESAFELSDPARVVVAFRPPAAESHYYSTKSKTVYEALMGHLADREGIHLIFLPRYPWQTEELKRWTWRSPVLVPEKPIPPVPLLKAADLVISSGGTMLREAAYLGVPAYSIFQSTIGRVDQELEHRGRLVFIGGAHDFDKLDFVKKSSADPAYAAAETMECLVQDLLTRTGVKWPQPLGV